MIAVAIIVVVSFFVFVIPHPPDDPKVVIPQSIEQVVESEITPEFIAHNFVIPANGTVSVPRQNRACVGNSKLGSLITRQLKPREVVYTSRKSEDEFARIWLYSQGDSSSCRERYSFLQSKGLIH